MMFIFQHKLDKPTGPAVSNFKQSPAKPDGYIVSCPFGKEHPQNSCILYHLTAV